MNIVLATTYVLGDEKALGLSEMHKQRKRYQIIKVIRGDKPAVYTEDLGSAKKFRGIDQFYIPSYMEHTVNELKEMADQMRSEQLFDKRELVGMDRIKIG